MYIEFFSGFALFLCRAENLCSESVVDSSSSAWSRVIRFDLTVVRTETYNN